MLTLIIIIFLLIAPFFLKGGWILGIIVYGWLIVFFIECLCNKNNKTEKQTDSNITEIKEEYDSEQKIIQEINQKFEFDYEVDMYLGEVLKNIYEKNVDTFYEVWKYLICKYHDLQDNYFIGTSLGEYILKVIDNNTYIFEKMTKDSNLILLLYKGNGYIDYTFFNYLEYLIEEEEYEKFKNVLNFLYQNETYKKISRDLSRSKLTQELIECLKYHIDERVYKIFEEKIHNMSNTNYNKFKKSLDRYINKTSNESKIKLNNVEIMDKDYIVVLISEENIPEEIEEDTIKETPKEIREKIICDSKQIKLYADMLDDMKNIQFLSFSSIYKSDVLFYFRDSNCIIYFLHDGNIIGSKPKNDEYEDDYNYNICNNAYEDYLIPKEQLNKIKSRLKLEDENIIDPFELDEKEIYYIKKELGISDIEQYIIIRNELIIIKKFPIRYNSTSKIKEKSNKLYLLYSFRIWI